MIRLSYSMVFDTKLLERQVLEAEARVLKSLEATIRDRLRIVLGTQYDTYAALARKKHPYGRERLRNRKGQFAARGTPAAPKDFINKQSGKFYNSFSVDIRMTATGIALYLRTSMPDRSAMLRGTPAMKSRRFGVPLAVGIPEKFHAVIAKELGRVVSIRRIR